MHNYPCIVQDIAINSLVLSMKSREKTIITEIYDEINRDSYYELRVHFHSFIIITIHYR